MRWLVLLPLLLLCGCALKAPPWQQAPGAAAAELLRQDWLGYDNEQLLRFEGRLLFGSRKINLAAMLRVNGERRTGRLVLMGDMGLTLCDMDVTPSGFITHQAVPQLEKHERAQRHIARTLRRIFLLPLPSPPMPVWQREGERMLRQQTAEGQVLRVYDTATGRLLRLESPDEDWRALFSGSLRPGSDLPWPRRIEYRDASGGYQLQVLLLPHQPPS